MKIKYKTDALHNKLKKPVKGQESIKNITIDKTKQVVIK